VTIRSISERQEISDKYLEQIITVLSRMGFVKSIRGAQGGYRLTKAPEEYTVGMILRAIEGPLVPVACMADETNQCPRSGCCVTLDVWKQLDEAISGVVDNITLADLVAKHRVKLAAQDIVRGINYRKTDKPLLTFLWRGLY
jgi:Rrf2 family protein